jgi:hypothetical protein
MGRVRDWWDSTAPTAMPDPMTLEETGRISVELAAAREQNELLQESLVEQQMALDEAGWDRLGLDERHLGVNRRQLLMRVYRARLLARANPLIRRGLALRHGYVWGEGMSIAARATGTTDGEQDVNAVVQAFLDDEGNQRVLTSAQAREEAERALGTDGNLFYALFTSPVSGLVQVRPIPFDQVTDIITNPDDQSEPWFYRREWEAATPDPTSATGIVQDMRIALYPALGYRPRARTAEWAGVPVEWDAPVIAVQVNRPWLAKWGLPDAYSAVTWADLYKDFLTDWAGLMKALSKIAWRATSSDRTRKATQQGLQQALGRFEAGQAAVMSPDVTLEAVPKTGATVDSGSGRPLAAMVASALDVPVTMLLGDPGVSGARATAQTLDRPTELMAMGRREVWTAFYRHLLGHVIREAVRAPRGPLRGKLVIDDLGREQLDLGPATDATVDVTWPDLGETLVQFLVQAIVQADSTGKMPPLLVARLLMDVLGVDDVDEWLDELTDPETGEFKSPDTTAGDVAAGAFRRGADPFQALAGPPGQAPAVGQSTEPPAPPAQ